MTSVFDGMAGIINGVLGGTITVLPAVGSSFDLAGVFREEPIEVFDADGRGVLIMSPTLSLQKPQSASVAKGDVIQPPDGRQFKVVNGQPNGSPASDAFVIFELEDFAP